MNDRLFGAASLAFAGGYYLLARNIPASELADATGPAGLPVIYASVLAGLSIVLLVRSVAGGSPVKDPPDSGGSGTSRGQDPSYIGVGRAALTLAIGVVYVLAVPFVGYLPGISALIAATAWTYGASLNVRTLAVAVSGAVVLWLLFVWLLSIPQPPGWWADLLGLMLVPPGATPPSP
jgi:hypothetical protein